MRLAVPLHCAGAFLLLKQISLCFIQKEVREQIQNIHPPCLSSPLVWVPGALEAAGRIFLSWTSFKREIKIEIHGEKPWGSLSGVWVFILRAAEEGKQLRRNLRAAKPRNRDGDNSQNPPTLQEYCRELGKRGKIRGKNVPDENNPHFKEG